MFRYEYPLFESKKVLRVEMLEQLRDYPKNYLKLFFAGYGEGIVSGCDITWEEGKLSVHPGIMYHHGNLYFMHGIYTMECPVNGQLRYLKAHFFKEKTEPGKKVGEARMVLDEESPDRSCELEICRFRLQDGSKLRYHQENFRDHNTEYDTVNLIHAPFAAPRKSTLHPAILLAYAKETIRGGAVNVYDVSFAMQVLANDGNVTADCIREYIDARLDGAGQNGVSVFEGHEMYKGLLRVYEKQERKNKEAVVMPETRGIMLM